VHDILSAPGGDNIPALVGQIVVLLVQVFFAWKARKPSV
jgi:hypothetical protein